MTGEAEPETAVRVVTCDDHPLIGMMVAQVLNDADGDPPLEVVDSYDTPEALLAGWSRDRPEVFVIDLTLGAQPDPAAGLTLLRRLLGRDPTARALIYSEALDPLVVRQALDIGAHGFLSKSVPPSELVAAVRRVAAGERPVLDGTTATRLAIAVLETADHPSLSRREHQVIELVAAGRTNRQISTTLGISENSVKSLLKRAVTKLQAPDRASAVATAFRRGLLR